MVKWSKLSKLRQPHQYGLLPVRQDEVQLPTLSCIEPNFYTLANWLSFNENDLVSIFDIQDTNSTHHSNTDFILKHNSLTDANKTIISGITDLLINNQNTSL